MTLPISSTTLGTLDILKFLTYILILGSLFWLFISPGNSLFRYLHDKCLYPKLVFAQIHYNLTALFKTFSSHTTFLMSQLIFYFCILITNVSNRKHNIFIYYIPNLCSISFPSLPSPSPLFSAHYNGTSKRAGLSVLFTDES